MLILHKVQKGDTINTIAQQYNISVQRLTEDNELNPNDTLINGQILAIAYPEQTYTVKDKDTLYDIAKANGVTVMELLRNNPSLSDREYLQVGEELVVRYGDRDRQIRVNGMTFSFIEERVLRKTLPFLTYITVMGYQVDAEGNLKDIDDSNLIKMAFDYGVVPLMLVYSLNESMQGTSEISHILLNDTQLQEGLVTNIISVVNAKGYYGAIFGFQEIIEEDIPKYSQFIEYASERLHASGYLSGAVLIPAAFRYIEGEPFSRPYFSEIGQAVDGVILLSYQWATGYIPSIYQTSYFYLKNYLEVAVTQIPPEKIYLGVSRIAYDWELPYVEGESYATSLTIPRALELARQYNSEIFFDEVTQFPYFTYNFSGTEHVVWFKDARYIDAMLRLMDDYEIGGISIWNIMNFFRIWLLINVQYDIVKLLPVE